MSIVAETQSGKKAVTVTHKQFQTMVGQRETIEAAIMEYEQELAIDEKWSDLCRSGAYKSMVDVKMVTANPENFAVLAFWDNSRKVIFTEGY